MKDFKATIRLGRYSNSNKWHLEIEDAVSHAKLADIEFDDSQAGNFFGNIGVEATGEFYDSFADRVGKKYVWEAFYAPLEPSHFGKGSDGNWFISDDGRRVVLKAYYETYGTLPDSPEDGGWMISFPSNYNMHDRTDEGIRVTRSRYMEVER